MILFRTLGMLYMLSYKKINDEKFKFLCVYVNWLGNSSCIFVYTDLRMFASFALTKGLTTCQKKTFSFIFCPWKGFRTHVSKLVATCQNWFLARSSVWTAIISEKFTDFIERAATAIIRLTLFSLAASYKMYSISLQTKYANFVNWVKKKEHVSA